MIIQTLKAWYYEQQYSSNSSRNTAAKQDEKRCCVFFNPRTNLSRIKILLQIENFCCRKQIILLFATKLVDAASITTTDQLVLQQDDVMSTHLVVLANQKSGFTQLQQFNFAARQVCAWVEKCTASLFKLFHSNVVRRVGGFYCSYYRPLSNEGNECDADSKEQQ